MRSRMISMPVDFSTEVDIDMADIETEEMLDELKLRGYFGLGNEAMGILTKIQIGRAHV